MRRRMATSARSADPPDYYTATTDYRYMSAVPIVQGEPVLASGDEAPQRWSSGICDCMHDWRTCLSVLCCIPATTAQLASRLLPGARGLCAILTLVLWSCVLASAVPQESLEDLPHEYKRFLVQAAVGGVLLTGVLTLAARRAVRRHDGIVECSSCPLCLDCVCASCCTGCTQCMLLRHEGLGDGAYQLFSSTGGP